MHVDDLGLPFDITTHDFEGNSVTLWGVAAGASGNDFELERGHRIFLRAREARTGAALRMDEEVQFLARGDPRYGFWRLEPVSSAPDVDGWYECGSTERELDLLAVPRAGELPLYGIHLVPHVKLDGPTPARVEFTLERGLDVSLELAKGVAPWPADHDLLLVDEELWRALYRPRGRRYPAPLDELQAQCTVHFDEQGHALLRGLAPGSYRFLPLPNDLVLDPEFLRVDPGTLSVPVRWSVR